MDWVFLFIPGVPMESYVLPERPSGLKKAMALAGVPRSLQALTHLAGARHRGLGLPSRSSHRESTHTFLRATPPPNSLARYSAGDWTAFIILHITSPSRPSITISAQGRRLGSYHVPGVQTEGTSALRHKLAKQKTNFTLLHKVPGKLICICLHRRLRTHQKKPCLQSAMQLRQVNYCQSCGLCTSVHSQKTGVHTDINSPTSHALPPVHVAKPSPGMVQKTSQIFRQLQ